MKIVQLIPSILKSSVPNVRKLKNCIYLVNRIINFRHKSWYQNLCLLVSLDFYLVKKCFCLISEVFVLNINHIIHLQKAYIFLIFTFTLSPIYFPSELKLFVDCCTTSYDRTITAVMQWASSQSGLPSTVMLVFTLVYLNTMISCHV